MMSGPEPAALPMIRRIGFSGYLFSAARSVFSGYAFGIPPQVYRYFDSGDPNDR
jgi:hypothetical protein